MCETFFKLEFQKWTSSKTIIYDQEYLNKEPNRNLEMRYTSIEIKIE